MDPPDIAFDIGNQAMDSVADRSIAIPSIRCSEK